MTRTWRDYNFFLLGCVIVLIGFSLAMIYSVTLGDARTHGYFSRHLINLIVGCVAMLLLTVLDYHALQAWVRPLYLLGIGALAGVMVLGHIRGGAQSWLNLGLRTFQPSEPAKLLIIVALAAYWARYEHAGGSWKVQLGGLALAGIPLVLVFLQPDFGTTIVFVLVWLAMAWTAGLRWWQLVLLLIIAIPGSIYGWNHILRDYQRLRLLIFIDPLKYDPTLENGAWDVTYSLNAIGSGGLTGHGWTHGIITQAHYVSAMYSDFIFAATGEELGFIGAAVLLLFETLLIWQALVVATVARDSFGRLIAVGVAALFLSHLLVNVGVNMSVMPVTGIPLPFISYGGSFTMTTLAAIGLVESVALHRRRIVF
jgi:rod shape determining protein RodA